MEVKHPQTHLRIYLDDETLEKRPTPNGWLRARWPEEVIELLKLNAYSAYQGGFAIVSDISLDHDLADEQAAKKEERAERTGYDVLLFLEEMVSNDPDYPIPNVVIHTANPVGRDKMIGALESIKRIRDKSESLWKAKKASREDILSVIVHSDEICFTVLSTFKLLVDDLDDLIEQVKQKFNVEIDSNWSANDDDIWYTFKDEIEPELGDEIEEFFNSAGL